MNHFSGHARSMFSAEDATARDAVAAYVKLLRASRAVLERVSPLLAEHRLTPTQFGVLEALLHGGPQSHGDLGRKVLSSAGNMTDVVDKLEARKLVCRCRDAADRRTVRVALTESGRVMTEALSPRHAADIAQAMWGLSRDELCQLEGLLQKLDLDVACDEVPVVPLAVVAHAP